jgi:hypothetical protein
MSTVRSTPYYVEVRREGERSITIPTRQPELTPKIMTAYTLQEERDKPAMQIRIPLPTYLPISGEPHQPYSVLTYMSGLDNPCFVSDISIWSPKTEIIAIASES